MPERPTTGGSYVRQPDGSLTRAPADPAPAPAPAPSADPDPAPPAVPRKAKE